MRDEKLRNLDTIKGGENNLAHYVFFPVLLNFTRLQ